MDGQECDCPTFAEAERLVRMVYRSVSILPCEPEQVRGATLTHTAVSNGITVAELYEK